jgi:subfamily B ATP-binding cassette protein MsbA
VHRLKIIALNTFSESFTIIGNLLFTVFNLLSLVLFIPFLQLIFSSKELKTVVKAPHYSGNLENLPSYWVDLYNYEMHHMVVSDPKRALISVCLMVFGAFFLLFRLQRLSKRC